MDRYANICRICVEESFDMSNLFDGQNRGVLLTDMISAFTRINIQPSDNRPSEICHCCLKDLIAAYDFYNLIQESEQKLLQLFPKQSLSDEETDLLIPDSYCEPLSAFDPTQKHEDTSDDSYGPRANRMKRSVVFNHKHAHQYPFLERGSTASDVRCTVCLSEFSIAHRGKADIEKHLQAMKHKRALKMFQKSESTATDKKTEPYDGINNQLFR